MRVAPPQIKLPKRIATKWFHPYRDPAHQRQNFDKKRVVQKNANFKCALLCEKRNLKPNAGNPLPATQTDCYERTKATQAAGVLHDDDEEDKDKDEDSEDVR